MHSCSWATVLGTVDSKRDGEAMSLERDTTFGSTLGSAENWYAVYTRARHEKKVAVQMQEHSIEFFLPLYKQQKRWNNGLRVQIESPLFPGYLFTRIHLSRRLEVLKLSGVVSFICTGNGCPVALPVSDIDHLKIALDKFRTEPHPFLTIGQSVRIIAGPLAGLEGILIAARNQSRVVLSIDLIKRSVAIEVDSADIEQCSTNLSNNAHCYAA